MTYNILVIYNYFGQHPFSPKFIFKLPCLRAPLGDYKERKSISTLQKEPYPITPFDHYHFPDNIFFLDITSYSRRKYYCYHQNTKWLWCHPIIHFSLLLLVKLSLLILFASFLVSVLCFLFKVIALPTIALKEDSKKITVTFR